MRTRVATRSAGGVGAAVGWARRRRPDRRQGDERRWARATDRAGRRTAVGLAAGSTGIGSPYVSRPAASRVTPKAVSSAGRIRMRTVSAGPVIGAESYPGPSACAVDRPYWYPPRQSCGVACPSRSACSPASPSRPWSSAGPSPSPRSPVPHRPRRRSRPRRSRPLRRRHPAARRPRPTPARRSTRPRRRPLPAPLIRVPCSTSARRRHPSSCPRSAAGSSTCPTSRAPRSGSTSWAPTARPASMSSRS